MWRALFLMIGTNASGFLVLRLVFGKMAGLRFAGRGPAQACAASVPGRGLEADPVGKEVKRVHLVERVHGKCLECGPMSAGDAPLPAAAGENSGRYDTNRSSGFHVPPTCASFR